MKSSKLLNHFFHLLPVLFMFPSASNGSIGRRLNAIVLFSSGSEIIRYAMIFKYGSNDSNIEDRWKVSITGPKTKMGPAYFHAICW